MEHCILYYIDAYLRLRLRSYCEGGGLNELHLFAGAGGGILGGKLLGHTCVCAVEIEKYCRDVLFQRQRDGMLTKFPIWDDIKTFDGTPWRGRVDVVCGGFPCQDISSAGKGEGITGERSRLWSEMARVIGEVQPSFAFVENSPVLVSRGLGVVLGDLAEMGYNARWGVYGADDVGAPHHRKRIWILAYSKKLFGNGGTVNGNDSETQTRQSGGGCCSGYISTYSPSVRQSKQGMYGRRISQEEDKNRKTNITQSDSENRKGAWVSEPRLGRVAQGGPFAGPT